MTRYVFPFVLVLLASSAWGQQIGALEGQRLTSQNEPALFETSITYAIARQGQRAIDSTALVRGFAEQDMYVYSLSSKLDLIRTKKEGRLVESHWSVTRWEYLEPSAYITENLGPSISSYFLNEIALTAYAQEIGCLSQAPLRYGDVEQDGNGETVLFLDEELVIFSPGYGRTVFAVFMSANDWMRIPEYQDFDGAVSAVDGKSYQYSSELIGSLYEEPHQAHRSYAKIFQGDFDEDGSPDILTWQKVYASNEVGQEQGFSLVDSAWQHFERDLVAQAESDRGVTGEYLPQDTDVQTIQSWLTENDLTWSKGYPSTSECEGQEGELIPEMHDPLLNDPEVLQ